MLLSDERIHGLIKDGVLNDAKDSKVGPVSYDLTTKEFCTSEGATTSVVLAPGDSVFVASVETIALPNDLTARVSLRNSRIRQGLALDAPIYFPGHHTRVFFRITNISSDEIRLDVSRGIAQLVFEHVDGKVLQPYSGAFVDEFDYRGLADYSEVYSGEIKELEEKREELVGMEARIYERTIALLAIFAAVFTLVNINAGTMASGGSASVMSVNLSIVGGFSSLVGLIAVVLNKEGLAAKVLPFAIAAVAFVAAHFL